MSKLAQESLGLRAAARRPARRRHALVQPHRRAAGPVVRRGELRAAGRARRVAARAARAARRQPGAAARPDRRARHRARLRRARGARHLRHRLQRVQRPRARSSGNSSRGSCRRAAVRVEIEVDPALLPAARRARSSLGDATRLRRDTGWEPHISFDRTLDDLLAYWRPRHRARAPLHRPSVGRPSPLPSLTGRRAGGTIRIAKQKRNMRRRCGIGAAQHSLPARCAAAHHPRRRADRCSDGGAVGPGRGGAAGRRCALPGSAVPVGAQPRRGHAVRVDAESVPRAARTAATTASRAATTSQFELGRRTTSSRR